MALPDDDEMAEIAAPITFLVLRANLARLRRAADQVEVSAATRGTLDALLAETEHATQELLMRQGLPAEGDIDEIFDEEFLEICKAMRVDLFAWVGQPQVLWRLGDPDGLLARWVEVLGHDDGLAREDLVTTASFAQRMAEMEGAINATFAVLIRNHVI